MAAKDIKRIVNILGFAGVTRPTAKLGQALGPLGLNMAQVCKDYNEMTQHIRPEVPIRARLYAYYDKTYKIVIHGPPTSWMIKKAMGTPVCSQMPGDESAGFIAITSIYEIAKIKKEIDPFLKDISLEAVCRVMLM